MLCNSLSRYRMFDVAHRATLNAQYAAQRIAKTNKQKGTRIHTIYTSQAVWQLRFL